MPEQRMVMAFQEVAFIRSNEMTFPDFWLLGSTPRYGMHSRCLHGDRNPQLFLSNMVCMSEPFSSDSCGL